jgi:hypothetical protein
MMGSVLEGYLSKDRLECGNTDRNIVTQMFCLLMMIFPT